MRLRFTIRDLLWLTLVAALCLAWYLDHRRLAHYEYLWNYQIDSPFDPSQAK